MVSVTHPSNSPARWRHPAVLVGLAAAFLSAAASLHANADIVRISSVNGDYEAAHADQIDVKPGDVVQLSADVFTDNGDGTFAPQNKDVADFVWAAGDSTTDRCDASQGAACLGPSNFEVNDYGVSFLRPLRFCGTVHHDQRGRLGQFRRASRSDRFKQYGVYWPELHSSDSGRDGSSDGHRHVPRSSGEPCRSRPLGHHRRRALLRPLRLPT